MPQKSSSPFSYMKKLNTDRSQNQILTTRNSSSINYDQSNQKVISNQCLNIKKQRVSNVRTNNNSQTVSYYYKNVKQNGKKLDCQKFSHYIKNKNKTLKRQRCMTTVDITTNKIRSQIHSNRQQNTQIKQQNTYIKQQNTYIKEQKVQPTLISLIDNQEPLKNSFCQNHHHKIGHFEEIDSFKCFCHQCSIEFVKNNKRLIPKNHKIEKLKEFFQQKIQQTEIFRNKFIQFVNQSIEDNIKSLQMKYNQIKLHMVDSHSKNYQTQQNQVQFALNEINYNLLNQLTLNDFLGEASKMYKISLKQQIGQKNCKSIQTKQNKKKPVYKQFNLINQIQKALNYNPRGSKTKRNSIYSIKKQQISIQSKHNKQNMNPNIIQKASQQDHFQRISFGFN